jgi:hypothetical protein
MDKQIDVCEERVCAEKVFYSNITKLMWESSSKLHAAGKMSDAEFAKYEILCCRPTKETNMMQAKINQACTDNPDLPRDFVKGTLEAMEEETTPWDPKEIYKDEQNNQT